MNEAGANSLASPSTAGLVCSKSATPTVAVFTSVVTVPASVASAVEHESGFMPQPLPSPMTAQASVLVPRFALATAQEIVTVSAWPAFLTNQSDTESICSASDVSSIIDDEEEYFYPIPTKLIIAAQSSRSASLTTSLLSFASTNDTLLDEFGFPPDMPRRSSDISSCSDLSSYQTSDIMNEDIKGVCSSKSWINTPKAFPCNPMSPISAESTDLGVEALQSIHDGRFAPKCNDNSSGILADLPPQLKTSFKNVRHPV